MIRLLLLLLLPSVAAAEPAFNTLSGALPEVPTSPAFALLGVETTDVLRPATLHGLLGDLKALVDSEGTVNPGLGVEVAPLWMAIGPTTTLDEWQADERGVKFWSRVSLSVAMHVGIPIVDRAIAVAEAALDPDADVASDDEDPPLRIAEGLRVVLYDWGDPRDDLRYVACVERVLGAEPPTPPASLHDIEGTTVEPLSERARASLQVCEHDQSKRLSGSPAGMLALAFSQSTIEDRSLEELRLYGSFGLGPKKAPERGRSPVTAVLGFSSGWLIPDGVGTVAAGASADFEWTRVHFALKASGGVELAGGEALSASAQVKFGAEFDFLVVANVAVVGNVGGSWRSGDEKLGVSGGVSVRMGSSMTPVWSR